MFEDNTIPDIAYQYDGQAYDGPRVEPQKHIGDLIDLNNVKTKTLNLVSSGCGTGKSYLALRQLRNHFEGVRPEDIIVVTSRSLAVDQQAQYDGVAKFTADMITLMNYWNGDERGAIIFDEDDKKVHVMTYNKFIYLLDYCNNEEHETLCNAKIIIFDECHVLFSDTFMSNLLAVRVWLYMTLLHTDKIIFGMTATPGIIMANKKRLGVRINRLNEETFMIHKVKKLICSDLDSVPLLVKGFKGKTLIMCKSYTQCEWMAAKIPNSFVLTSVNNEHFTNEMSWVRGYIATKSKFPDYRMAPKYADDPIDLNLDLDDPFDELPQEKRGIKLDVLIATSTIREGFSLMKDSNVKNIVCCIPDDLHVIQVAGRARYDLDNLVVAAPLRGNGTSTKVDSYLRLQREEFKKYLRGNSDGRAWLSRIAHILHYGPRVIEKKLKVVDIAGFAEWFEPAWLTVGDDEKRLFQEEDRNEVSSKCLEHGLVAVPPSKMSFQKALKGIEVTGYAVTTGRAKVDGRLVTYKVFRKNEEGACA